MAINVGFDELLELESELQEYIAQVEKPMDILEIGAKFFVIDLLKLPKPKSKIKTQKHTHLVDSFSYKESSLHPGEINVGWGKYYGPFVENGAHLKRGGNLRAQPHLKPLWNKNKEKYYALMLEKFYI